MRRAAHGRDRGVVSTAARPPHPSIARSEQVRERRTRAFPSVARPCSDRTGRWRVSLEAGRRVSVPGRRGSLQRRRCRWTLIQSQRNAFPGRNPPTRPSIDTLWTVPSSSLASLCLVRTWVPGFLRDPRDPRDRLRGSGEPPATDSERTRSGRQRGSRPSELASEGQRRRVASASPSDGPSPVLRVQVREGPWSRLVGA